MRGLGRKRVLALIRSRGGVYSFYFKHSLLPITLIMRTESFILIIVFVVDIAPPLYHLALSLDVSVPLFSLINTQ